MGNTNTHPANKTVSTYCTLELPETASEGEKSFVFGKAVTSFFTLKEPVPLQFLSKELKNHPWVVQNAVLTNGYWLRDASEDLRANKSLVTTAVISCVNAIKFASPHLKQDIPFIVHLIQSMGQQNLYYLLQELQPDLLLNPLILTAIALKCRDAGHDANVSCNRVFTLFGQTHYNRMDPYVLCEALKRNSIFSRIRPELQSKHWEAALSFNVWQARYMDPGLKDNLEVAEALVKINGSLFAILSFSIKADEGILSTAMLTCPDVLRYAPPLLQTYERKIYAISKKATLIRSFPEMLHDRGAVLCAVRQTPSLLLFASQQLQEDRQVVVTALLRRGELFASLRPTMRTPKLQALAENLWPFSFEPPITFRVFKTTKKLGRVEFIQECVNKTDAFSTFLLSAHYFSQAQETTKKRLVSTNTLQMLNQHGPHFARILKMKIASYVGVYFDIIGDLRLALEDARK